VPARLKSPGAAPVRVRALSTRSAPPVFCTVMVCWVLAPKAVLPNANDKALNSMRACGRAVTVPVKARLCGLLAALWLTSKLAKLVPAATGVN
jgi:hypothetical protein